VPLLNLDVATLSKSNVSGLEKTRPRIALLGDSYIEGFPTDVEDHVDTRLHDLAGGEADVYAFGRSGWYLAQYVALARYVGERFAPDTYILFLNAHDLQDSLRENGVKTPYAFQITRDGASFAELKPPARFVFTMRSRTLRRSALVRYVRANLGITWGQKDALVEDANLRAADTSDPEPQVASLIQAAAAHMIDRLVRDHRESTFVLVVDTERDRIYAGQPVEDPRVEFDAIVRAARRHATVHVLDLDPVFREAFSRDGRRFDGADGNHWDSYGNRIVAEAVHDYLLARGLLPRADEGDR
jgi:hypothetical protein